MIPKAVTLMLVLSLLACSKKNGGLAPVKMVASFETFNLTDDQIKQHEIAALRGDPEAAARLAEFYSFVKNDEAASFEWLELAAKNGGDLEKENLRVTVEVLKLSTKEIRVLKQEAKSGDKSAAGSLGDYYWCIENDKREALQWYQLAATYGGREERRRCERCKLR